MTEQQNTPGRTVIWDGGSRPNFQDIFSRDYDQPPSAEMPTKLLICALPRSMGWALMRYLMAAGIGVGCEYFYPDIAETLAKRWQIDGDLKKSPRTMDAYCAELLSRRQVNGCFVAKMFYWQFERYLRNDPGRALFQDAKLIYLMRDDIAFQAASLAMANLTGQWDHDASEVGKERNLTPGEELSAYGDALDELLVSEMKWRRFFAYTGQTPMIVTFNEITSAPERTIARIADMMGVEHDADMLGKMIALEHRYEGWREQKASIYERACEAYRDRAFEKNKTAKLGKALGVDSIARWMRNLGE